MRVNITLFEKTVNAIEAIGYKWESIDNLIREIFCIYFMDRGLDDAVIEEIVGDIKITY